MKIKSREQSEMLIKAVEFYLHNIVGKSKEEIEFLNSFIKGLEKEFPYVIRFDAHDEQ